MADDRAITAKQFDMMKKEFDKMKKEMEQREKKIEQRMDMLQESLATLVSSTPKQQSQMPPPSVSGSDSKRANSASGGDRKRAKTEEDDKKSINPSECSIATRKQIIGKAPDELDDMELEDWQFDQIIELKECPEKLYKRVFSVLRKYLKYGQKVKRMNEATRKHIVGAVLVEIVWFVTKQFDPTKIKMPKLNVEGSLVWAFGERKIRGRYDLSIYGKHYPIRDFFFVIEMKANQSLLLGRDQCLIYMKRTWELNENEAVYGFSCDLLNWQLIKLAANGADIQTSGEFNLVNPKQNWDKSGWEAWTESCGLFVQTVYTIIHQKLTNQLRLVES